MDLGIDGIGPGERIGAGGSAVVYSAIRESIGDQVAVKVLLGLTSERDVRHFAKESRSLSILSDVPGIVAVLDSGVTTTGQPYLVMPFMAGGSMEDHLDRNGPLEWRDAVGIVATAAEAVQRAHDHGIFHRDMKPANLLRTASGEVFVADFGIAYLADSSLSASTSASLTPLYAPPEVFDLAPAHPTADVYSLAGTLVALTLGEPPFYGGDTDTPLAAMRRVLTHEPARLNDLVDGVPTGLADIVSQAMAKEAHERPQTAAVLARALRETITDAANPITDSAPPAPNRALHGGASADPTAREAAPQAGLVEPPTLNVAHREQEPPTSAGLPWSPAGPPLQVPSFNQRMKRLRKELARIYDDVYLRSHEIIGDPGAALLEATYALHLPYTVHQAGLNLWLFSEPANSKDWMATDPEILSPTVVLGLFFDPRFLDRFFLRYDHLDIEAATELEPDRHWKQEGRSTWRKTPRRVVTPTDSVTEAIELFDRLEHATARPGIAAASHICVAAADPRFTYDRHLNPTPRDGALSRSPEVEDGYYVDELDYDLWFAEEHWQRLIGPGESTGEGSADLPAAQPWEVA